MFWLLLFSFALLGLFVGSFLNVCIDRLPKGQSIINPPSHCPACQHKLSVLDLVPIFSYLWLRRHCRYCRAIIPIRLPVVEGLTGLLFSFLYWKFGLSLELGILLFYACLMIVIFMIDLENQLVLDKITYPAMIVALALSLFSGLGVINSLIGGAIGLAAIGLPFIIAFFIYHHRSVGDGMGMGDVKLGALIGLMTGYPLAIVAVLLGIVCGGLIASLLLVFKIKGRRDAIPFGPFLAASAMVTLLWGQSIYKWYFTVDILSQIH